jgi:signal transduction histidine kinase
MDIAREPVEASQSAERARFWRASDNALARAVGRIPLPLGAKLLIGFGAVAALLAVGYVLGLVALGQSNSRSVQLRRLQQRAVYEQLLLTDARTLQAAIKLRLDTESNRPFVTPVDLTIANEFNQLCDDAGIAGTGTSCLGPSDATRLPLKLSAIDPALSSLLDSSTPLFYPIAGAAPPAPVVASLERADSFVRSFAAKLSVLASRTRVRANALVAADHSSYADSRNLLLGVGAGSLAIALALGLLIAWSVVTPLRQTEDRLDEIAAGDFDGRLEVTNRDEIGRLAVKVNSTSDELRRVYGELELASEHKSQFLANMSHELRTPLNAIIGFSEVLHEQMFGELNERQLAYVEDVLAAGRHLLSLINDVLDLAKIEAGRMDLELSEVAIPDILRSAVSMHSERATDAGVELTVATEPEEILVTADERRFRQIVVNLLSNAVKFTPQGGHVDVSARLDDGHVEIAVADTGSGIAPEDQQTIFEEFEQTTEGKQAEGTGLGLPLSRKLVELHHGRLWVESEPGRGSTFRFTLPVRQDVS